MAFGLFSLPLLLTCFTLLTAAQSQQIIADPEVTAYLGGDVTLYCRLQSKSTLKITQVQWTWESTEKKKEIIVVYNPAHGTHYFNSTFSGRVVYTNQSLGHVYIYITGVKLTDKGKFTCQYTTFPNGIMKTTSTLIVKENLPSLSPEVVAGIVMVILLVMVLLAASLYFILKRRYVTSMGIITVCCSLQPNVNEEQELTYADVRAFSKAKEATKSPATQTECEYAEVNRGSQSANRRSAPSPALHSHAEHRDVSHAQVRRT